jgi:CD80-like C2-set immunoglobulin domain/Immunoglobulin domain
LKIALLIQLQITIVFPFLSDFDSVNNNENENNNFKQLLSDTKTPNFNIRDPFSDEISYKSLFHDDPSLSDMMDDARVKNVSVRREKRFARSHFEDGKNVDEFVVDEPYALPLRPIVRGPFDGDEQALDEVSIVYVEPRSQVKLNCEVDLDIQSSVWLKDGQMVQAIEAGTRSEIRFIKEPRGGITINNVMLEDDGYWQCEAENFRGYMETGRSTKLVVLTPPRPPYLTFDGRRLDASNLFIPVKENAEIALSCVSEGGNPKPLLTWEILLNPSVDHHSLKLPPDSLEVQVIKTKEKDKDYKINSGAKSDAKLPIIYRAHHNARVLCVLEHPSLKVRQNASIVLDVQCKWLAICLLFL